MEYSNIITVIIALAILYNGYLLLKKQSQMKKDFADLKKQNEDLNIEFGAMEGTGIQLVKKQYPDLEIRDDHGESVAEAHSTANGMNDPSEMQKREFREQSK